MNVFSSNRLWLRAALVGLVALGASASPALAQNKVIPAPAPVAANNNGVACTTGNAEVTLDANNVRAVLYNIGGLFWRGSGAQYEVPAGGGVGAIFASGIWVGGQVNGDLRFAGSTYGPWEYWPGPLDANGTTTVERCQEFDRFWKVTDEDIEAYDETGAVASDLQSWPIAFGAPFYVDTNGDGQRNPGDEDEDGEVDEPRIELDIDDPGYGTRQLNLAAGERPDIIGDQGIWWVMNDEGSGASHDFGFTPAIRLEVRAQAFAFETADALNNTTFYRYQFVYRGSEPMTDTYIGIFSDPDLGDFNDDYVGSDPSLGLGFVYNGDSFDGSGGYGAIPPALGYDFFQGPLVGNGEGSPFNDGEDNDGDGEVDEEDERLAVEKFFYFTNGGTVTSDPDNGEEAYSYMQGLWKDGSPLREGGDGFNTNGPVVDFAFPGSPPGFWSEYNIDGTGNVNTPADRRFGVSSGPFTFQPGQTQTIVFGIVWSQAVGATVQPQIQSVRQLKFDDRTVQAAFNAEFDLPEPPPPVDVVATGLDQQIILEFSSATGNLNDLFGYEVRSPFAPASATDNTYNFEGIKIFQYRNPSDGTGTLVATLDIRNNITTVIDEALDPNVGEVVTAVVAQGTDSGEVDRVPTAFNITTDAFTSASLRNGTSYYFGVQPYAVNEASVGQRVFAAPVRRVEVRPTRVGPVIVASEAGFGIDGIGSSANVGGGSVSVEVVNPAALTDDSFRVEFFTQRDTDDDGNEVAAGTNYRIVNETTGEVVFDGARYFEDRGVVAPQGTGVFRAGGLSFNVQGPPDGFTTFIVTQNAAGPITPPTGGSADFAGFPVPERPGAGQQVADAIWFVDAGPGIGSLEDWIGRVVRNDNASRVYPFDYEFRFTGTSTAYQRFVDPATDPPLVEIPFEIWNTGIGTPDDPSDDYRMVPAILDINGNGIYDISSFGEDDESPISSNIDDPFTDWVYWYNPLDTTPGESGYEAWLANAGTAPTDHGGEVLARTVFTGWNLGAAPPFPAPHPEPGTVFRIETAKPNQPGDTFTVSASEFAAVDADERDAEAREEALDLISITPNPYRAFSGYETSGNQNIARFLNLPAQATIRVYTLSGTLIRTLEKGNLGATLDWDLRTEAGLPAASGVYLIHVEARQSDGTVLGERILKFGLIQRRTQLDVL